MLNMKKQTGNTNLDLLSIQMAISCGVIVVHPLPFTLDCSLVLFKSLVELDVSSILIDTFPLRLSGESAFEVVMIGSKELVFDGNA